VGIELLRTNITRVPCDVMVTAANPWLGGIGSDLPDKVGGVDGAIHRAAGLGLLEECESLPRFLGITNGELQMIRCAHGDLRITGSHLLPCHHVFHAVAPRHQRGADTHLPVLMALYLRIFDTVRIMGLSSIAIPGLGTGSYGIPIEDGARVAVHAARSATSKMQVIFCAPRNEEHEAYAALLSQQEWS
jgi:O-acetyl-ADP-ribose deacetylase